MVQETVTEVIPTTPAPTEAPVEEQAPAVEPPSEGADSTEVTEEPAPEPTFSHETLYEANPKYKEWYDGTLEEKTSEAKHAGLMEGFRNVNELSRQAEERKEQAIEAIADLNATFKDMAERGQGLDATTFGRLLQRHAPSLNLIPKILADGAIQPAVTQGAAVATASVLAMLAGEDKDLMGIASRLVERTNQRDEYGNEVFLPSTEFHVDRGQKAITDFMKKMRKSVETAAEDRGYQRGLKDQKGAAVEAQKAQEREGVGPSSVSGSGSGGKKYSTMTFEERQKLSPEERDRLVAQELGA